MTAEIYWISGLESGRLAILGRPRAGDWLDDEIADWRSAGVTDIVSLLEDHEMRELGLTQEGEVAVALTSALSDFRSRIVACQLLFEPRMPCGVISPRRYARGRASAFHCRAGIGRSGLIVAGTLVQLGTPGHEAWDRTARSRGIPVPDTEQQKDWLDRAFPTRVERRLEGPDL